MTILNIAWRPDRVLVGVDTKIEQMPLQPGSAVPQAPAGLGLDGEATKLVHLPACGAVLAVRGHIALLHHLCFAALSETVGAPRHGGLDLLLEKFGAIVRTASERVGQEARVAGVPTSVSSRYEVAIAGWSSARGQMCAVVAYQNSQRQGQTVCELDEALPTWFAPWDDTPGWPPEEPPPPTTASEMHALAQVQVDVTRRLGCNGFGGRSLVAELALDRTEVSARTLD